MTVFALIIGIVGAYAGATFARLELLDCYFCYNTLVCWSCCTYLQYFKTRKKQVKFIESSKKGTTQEKSKKQVNYLEEFQRYHYVAVIVASY